MKRREALWALGGLSLAGHAFSQGVPALSSEELAENVYVVSGDGGNIGVVTAKNAVMLIDGGFPNRAKELLQAISDHVDSDQITIVFNTHWHPDHVGCNETLGVAGGVKIMAHENVKKRLSAPQTIEAMSMPVDRLKPAGIPTETFTVSGKLTFGTVDVEYVHVPTAHTDGDSYLFFPDANVLHTGDLLFNGTYPFIDYSSGGWLGGMEAAAQALQKVGDASTQIIPGHGPMATQEDLKASSDMLSTVRGRLEKLLKQGRSLDQVVAAAPLKDLDEKWGGGSMKPELFLRIAYTGMLRREKG